MVSKDFVFVKRHQLYETPEFRFEVDEYARGGDQLLIGHVHVERWSPSVKRECHRVWDAFRKCVTSPIFTLGRVDDAKFEKFVRSFGYETFQTVTCLNGEQRRLFIHKVREAQDAMELRSEERISFKE